MTADGPSEYETWKTRRLAALTAPDGWLTTIGRYRLTAGPVRVGSAGDNDIVLSAGPAHVGILRQDEAGDVVFAPADGSRETALSIVPWKPARLQAGDLLLEVVRFNDENALRVRHTTAQAPHAFGGLSYFPYAPGWRIVADWHVLETARKLTIDFNKAVNPPCAFSAHTTCPFPPPENVLPIRIEAGERAVAPLAA